MRPPTAAGSYMYVELELIAKVVYADSDESATHVPDDAYPYGCVGE